MTGIVERWSGEDDEMYVRRVRDMGYSLLEAGAMLKASQLVDRIDKTSSLEELKEIIKEIGVKTILTNLSLVTLQYR